VKNLKFGPISLKQRISEINKFVERRKGLHILA
jgi:hypothetical protein